MWEIFRKLKGEGLVKPRAMNPRFAVEGSESDLPSPGLEGHLADVMRTLAMYALEIYEGTSVLYNIRSKPFYDYDWIHPVIRRGEETKSHDFKILASQKETTFNVVTRKHKPLEETLPAFHAENATVPLSEHYDIAFNRQELLLSATPKNGAPLDIIGYHVFEYARNLEPDPGTTRPDLVMSFDITGRFRSIRTERRDGCETRGTRLVEATEEDGTLYVEFTPFLDRRDRLDVLEQYFAEK